MKDIRTTEVVAWEERGEGNVSMYWDMAGYTILEPHISEKGWLGGFPPPFFWFHQHLNVTPARYLAITEGDFPKRLGIPLEVEKIEKEQEDPAIRRPFEIELQKARQQGSLNDHHHEHHHEHDVANHEHEEDHHNRHGNNPFRSAQGLVDMLFSATKRRKTLVTNRRTGIGIFPSS